MSKECGFYDLKAKPREWGFHCLFFMCKGLDNGMALSSSFL